MNLLITRFGFLAVATGLFFAPGPATAGSATEQLRFTIEKFVNILTNTPVSELRVSGLPEAARKLVFERFDFAEMTRLSLGDHWMSLETSEQLEFVAALTHRMLATYGRAVRSGGEEVRFKREVMDGQRARVETEVDGDGELLKIHYQLHDIGGQWKVFDVVIGDVSIVRNFRAQFDRVIAKSSVRELLQRIKQENS